MDANRSVVVSVAVVPMCDDPYPVVDRAIAAIQASGVRYEVGPMETVLEGTLDACLAAARAAHETCFVAGAQRAVTYIKISDSVSGTTIAEKVAKYR